jgi:hypothetical protein
MKPTFFKIAIRLAVTFCFTVTVADAQPVDSTERTVHIPSKVFSRISNRASKMDRDITRQTERYLERISREERQLQQKLASIDPNAAQSLFGASQQQYAALAAQLRGDTTRRSVPLRGQYFPYADTLQGAMSFLKLNPNLVAGGANPSAQIASKLQSASGEFQLLQAKMQDADAIKGYVQSRQQQINEYITQHTSALAALGKPLAAMQQEEYYYSQRVAQYKAMLSDPDALVQRALGMLGQLPAFQNFMKTHSQLGSLFHVPGNYGTAPNTNGIQTKEQVAQAVQGQIGGTAGATAFQSNLQSAQSQLDDYKSKLSKLGIGNGDAQMPNFKPNDQKTRAFLKRLQYGFDFQATHYNNYYPALLSLGVSLGYKLGHSNVVGIGAAYELGTGNGINDVHLTSQGLGLRSFVDFKIKGSLSASVEEPMLLAIRCRSKLTMLERAVIMK